MCNRTSGTNGRAEIAMGESIDVATKLDIQRLIQPQLLADVLHDVVAGTVSGQQTGRIAGDHV